MNRGGRSWECVCAGVGLSLLALDGPAVAADMPVKAPYIQAVFDWTGLYVGANAGYAWGHSDPASSFTCPAPGACPYNVPVQLSAFNAAGTGILSPNGFTGGGQAGYNYQSGQLLYGVELDIESFRLNRSLTGGGLMPVG